MSPLGVRRCPFTKLEVIAQATASATEDLKLTAEISRIYIQASWKRNYSPVSRGRVKSNLAEKIGCFKSNNLYFLRFLLRERMVSYYVKFTEGHFLYFVTFKASMHFIVELFCWKESIAEKIA